MANCQRLPLSQPWCSKANWASLFACYTYSLQMFFKYLWADTRHLWWQEAVWIYTCKPLNGNTVRLALSYVHSTNLQKTQKMLRCECTKQAELRLWTWLMHRSVCETRVGFNTDHSQHLFREEAMGTSLHAVWGEPRRYNTRTTRQKEDTVLFKPWEKVTDTCVNCSKTDIKLSWKVHLWYDHNFSLAGKAGAPHWGWKYLISFQLI